MATKTKKVETKLWSKMTRAEKRTELAKDVLAQIRVGTIIPTHNTYCSIDTDLEDLNVQLNKELQKKTVTCKVCGIGSMFIAHVNKTNHCSVDEAELFDDNGMIEERLQNIFSVVQLNTIEAAFEGRVVNDENEVLSDQYGNENSYGDRVTKSLKRFKSPRSKMEAICNNIINNNGNFVV